MSELLVFVDFLRPVYVNEQNFVNRLYKSDYTFSILSMITVVFYNTFILAFLYIV